MQKVLEFMFRKTDWRGQQWIDARQYRFDRPDSMAKVLVDAGSGRIVVPCRIEHVEMVTNRVLEARECAVVEERRLQRGVAQRRTAELVAVVGIAGDLLQAEILVFAGAVEYDIALADAEFGAICGTPTMCILKSLNISFESPPTAWQLAQLPLPKKVSAPRFSEVDIAFVCPRANLSMGALARTSVNSNSAIARPNIVKSIGPPAATYGNRSPNSCRYRALPFNRASTSWLIGSLRNPEPSAGGTTLPLPSSN